MYLALKRVMCCITIISCSTVLNMAGMGLEYALINASLVSDTVGIASAPEGAQQQPRRAVSATGDIMWVPSLGEVVGGWPETNTLRTAKGSF